MISFKAFSDVNLFFKFLSIIFAKSLFVRIVSRSFSRFLFGGFDYFKSQGRVISKWQKQFSGQLLPTDFRGKDLSCGGQLELLLSWLWETERGNYFYYIKLKRIFTHKNRNKRRGQFHIKFRVNFIKCFHWGSLRCFKISG